MRDAWVRAESMGVDTLFNWDHLLPRFGDPDGNTYECWSGLAAMASVTNRVEIGPLVTVPAFRNPFILADTARTVDQISNGRLIFGLGAGGWEKDFAEAGVELTTNAARLRALERDLERIRDRWRRKNPPPMRSHIPVLIGGNGEKVTLQIVARHADIWNGQGDPETVAHLNSVLDRWCERVGRNPDEIERSVLLIRPRQLEQLDAYLDAGMTHVIYSVRAPENDFGPVQELLAWRDRRLA